MRTALYFLLLCYLTSTYTAYTQVGNNSAEWFKTPKRRLQWWNTLDDKWKIIFNKKVLFKKQTQMYLVVKN